MILSLLEYDKSMKTAVLVIDVQESFRQRKSWAQVSNPDIAADVSRLVDTARRAGHEVVWILHADTESEGSAPFNPASGFVRVFEGLDPAHDEPIIIKTSRNAFTTTNLGQYLMRRGVRRVAIAGIQTEQCCETTARLAADLGYDVTFVTEATATFPITRPDSGEVLGTAEIISHTEFALAGRFARISSIAQAFDVTQ